MARSLSDQQRSPQIFAPFKCRAEETKGLASPLRMFRRARSRCVSWHGVLDPIVDAEMLRKFVSTKRRWFSATYCQLMTKGISTTFRAQWGAWNLTNVKGKDLHACLLCTRIVSPWPQVWSLFSQLLSTSSFMSSPKDGFVRMQRLSHVKLVQFECDEETGAWTGEWTTAMDRSHATMISEELPGMDNIHIENMAEMVRQNNAENRPQVDVGDAASVGTSVNTEALQAALVQGPADANQGSTDVANSNDRSNNNNDPQQAGARTSPPVSTETAGHSAEGGRPGL